MFCFLVVENVYILERAQDSVKLNARPPVRKKTKTKQEIFSCKENRKWFSKLSRVSFADLSNVLPTSELFWLNLEEGYFACQVNASEKYLKLFKLSRLCDGFEDCFEATDELTEKLKCSPDCPSSNCSGNGVCMKTR